MTTTTGTRTTMAPGSRLPSILSSYQKNLQKIDALERALEAKVAEKRHRAVNILDEMPSYRRSTLRLYITHTFEEKEEVKTVQLPVTNSDSSSDPAPITITGNDTNINTVPAASGNVNVNVNVSNGGGMDADVPMMDVNSNGGNVAVPAANATTTASGYTAGQPGSVAPGSATNIPPPGTAIQTTTPASAAEAGSAQPAANANANANVNIKTETTKSNKWNLIIEGKLLIGHLDHERAQFMERGLKTKAIKEGRRYVTHSEMVVNTEQMTSRERAATRFMHDREGEERVVPILFSHFFDRVSVSFQTFQKKVDTNNGDDNDVDMSSNSELESEQAPFSGRKGKGRRTSTTPQKKKSNKGFAQKKSKSPVPKIPEKETYSKIGSTTSLFWNRQRPNSGGNSNSNSNANPPLQSALDTHAFHAVRTESVEPPSYENVVVATIRLHRRDQEQKYKPSLKFSQKLLPFLSSSSTSDINKKPKPIQEMDAPPEESDVYIPPVISMDDALDAVYQYVLHHNLLHLHDPAAAAAKAENLSGDDPAAAAGNVNVNVNMNMNINMNINSSQHSNPRTPGISNNNNNITEVPTMMISNDGLLEEVFGCKQMDMSTMKESLIGKGLLVPSVIGTPGDCPILLSYVMKKDTAFHGSSTCTGKASAEKGKTNMKSSVIVKDGIPSISVDTTAPEAKRRRTSTSPIPMYDDPASILSEDEEPTSNMLSCDVDIDVPHLFHSRCRDILRRIKIREYEYTSCRTKAMRTVELTKASEDIVKDRLENIVRGKPLTSGHQQVLAALAKAAPIGCEARISAHADARTTMLFDRMEQHCEKARSCWEIVDICRGGT